MNHHFVVFGGTKPVLDSAFEAALAEMRSHTAATRRQRVPRASQQHRLSSDAEGRAAIARMETRAMKITAGMRRPPAAKSGAAIIASMEWRLQKHRADQQNRARAMVKRMQGVPEVSPARLGLTRDEFFEFKALIKTYAGSESDLERSLPWMQPEAAAYQLEILRLCHDARRVA